ncbi:5377_t:CDS:2, partial [Acaulospora morrowiae]
AKMSSQNQTSFCELSVELKNREITSVIKICQDFDTFYELKKFGDVTIRIGSQSQTKTFYGHSFILYARSSFFQKVLTSDGNKIDNHTVSIPDISPKEFEVMLRYIYTGRIPLDGKSSLEIFNLLLAALKLDLEEAISHLQLHLVKYHHEWLCRNFSLVNDTCKQHQELVVLLNYCVKSPKALFMSEDFVKIEKQVLVELLGNNYLEVDVIEIWNMVLKWVLAKHPSINSNPKYWTPEEIKALSRSLENFIPLIQFRNLSPEQIDNSIQPYRKLFQRSFYEELVQTSSIEYFKITEEKNVLHFKIPETINSWFHGER